MHGERAGSGGVAGAEDTEGHLVGSVVVSESLGFLLEDLMLPSVVVAGHGLIMSFLPVVMALLSVVSVSLTVVLVELLSVLSELLLVLSTLSSLLGKVVVSVPDSSGAMVVRSVLDPCAGTDLMPLGKMGRVHVGLDRGHGEHNLILALVVENLLGVDNALLADLDLVSSVVHNDLHVALLWGRLGGAALDAVLVLSPGLLVHNNGAVAVLGGVGVTVDVAAGLLATAVAAAAAASAVSGSPASLGIDTGGLLKLGTFHGFGESSVLGGVVVLTGGKVTKGTSVISGSVVLSRGELVFLGKAGEFFLFSISEFTVNIFEKIVVLTLFSGELSVELLHLSLGLVFLFGKGTEIDVLADIACLTLPGPLFISDCYSASATLTFRQRSRS